MLDHNHKEPTNEEFADTPRKKGGFLRAVTTPFGWLLRMVFGASKSLTEDPASPKWESPSRLALGSFFRRKLAVAALAVLLALFLFVFIGPLFLPMDVNYTDALQANIAPNYAMLSVPRALKGEIRDINGYANFTVGVSNDNRLFMWGYTKDLITGLDYSDFPAEIRDGNVCAASAGYDHVIAITTDGKVVGWGNNSRGQYGAADASDDLLPMPDALLHGTVDISKIEQLTCGYQASALILDGKLYLWGNSAALLNMDELLEAADTYTAQNNTRVKKIALSNYYAAVLFEDGTMTGSNLIFNRESAVSSKNGKIKNFKNYLADKEIIDIAATDNCFAFLLSDGEILVNGAAKYGEDEIPLIGDGEKFVSLTAGTRHFAALTDGGKAWSWGHNDGGQASLDGVCADRIFAGAKQTYLTDAGGKLIKKVGFRGYLFGTDSRGRDILTRIVHGGKMTMTVGAVAVIVSSVIAIIIGCLAGYFGGWVDLLLMRLTEIFSAIPFLPFAMLLSFVLRYYPIGETMRIFIIMLILGLLSWTSLARIIRGQVLSEREKEFVLAAKSMGVRERKIAFRHILPNIISVILVSMTLDFAGCLLTESSLSYLGFGVQQPQPTWGNMLSGANNSIVIQNYSWQWIFPALFLSIATISINIIGDTLRDVLDPKSNREK